MIPPISFGWTGIEPIFWKLILALITGAIFYAWLLWPRKNPNEVIEKETDASSLVEEALRKFLVK